MRRAAITFSFSLFLMLESLSFASSDARKFIVYGIDEANCETEMAHLDNYAIALHSAPNTTAYIVAYGGRRDTARTEMKPRRSRIKRYLIKERGIEPKRIVVIDGGFRESLTIELWLVAGDSEMPKVQPTVMPKDVKYRKAKYSFNCSTFY